MQREVVCAPEGLPAKRPPEAATATQVGRARIPPEPSSTESLYTFAMVFRFRSAMMWLLLFALPLQGYATLTMLNCGPNHHRMMAAAIAEPDEAHQHASAEHHHDDMGMAYGHHEVASVDGRSDAPPLHHLNKLVKFKCNACVVCCTGAAMPTAIFTFEPLPPAMTPESFALISRVGFVTDGPDRPPRLSNV